MCQTGLKTGDLDFKLQGQIGLETKNFCVIRGKIPTVQKLLHSQGMIPCKCNNF